MFGKPHEDIPSITAKHLAFASKLLTNAFTAVGVVPVEVKGVWRAGGKLIANLGAASNARAMSPPDTCSRAQHELQSRLQSCQLVQLPKKSGPDLTDLTDLCRSCM